MEKFTPEIKEVAVDFDPFAGPAILRTIPTTEAQREVFVASTMGEDANRAYIESVSLRLEGELDQAAMELALRDVVARHESLRSTISADGMWMVVLEQTKLDIAFHDLRSLDDTTRHQRLSAMADADMEQVFNLVEGPLFRIMLVRTGEREHLLRLSGHHAVVDGWSLGILMGEISVLYNARLQGTPATLPPAIPYSAYVLATRKFARSTEHAAVEQYWMDLYADGIPRMDLPADRERPAEKTFNGDRLDLRLDPEMVRGLRTVATRNGASFVTTLLAAFEVLMHRLTHARDIVVGLPAAGQSDFDMKHLVGHCVNLLALRSTLAEGQSFDAYLKQRRGQVLDAFDHQRYTFGTLVQKVRVPREAGRIPLAPVVFNIDMNMDDGVSFQGLAHTFISNPRHYENFELFLNATGHGDQLVMEWSYNTDLFNASTIRRWMDELTAVIKSITNDSSKPVILPPTAASGEGNMPLPEWNGTQTSIPAGKSMNEVFAEVVAAHRGNTAIVGSGEPWTYGTLHERALSIAGALEAAGVGPGDFVGLCSDRCPEMVAAMLGTLYCGAAFMPLDPSYPAERLAYMINDSGIKAMLARKHLLDALPDNAAKVILLEEAVHAPASRTAPRGTAESAAYMMYTSGSTGNPKGVVVPHRAVIRLVRGQHFLDFGPDLTFLQLSNISFDAATLEIWGAVLNGAKLVLQPQQKPTFQEIADTIKQHQVDTVWFTSGLFNLMVDEHLGDLHGLKHVLAGGDALSVPHVRRALKELGPGVLINGYGPTENTTFTCCHAINSEADLMERVPIGRPIANTSAYILDEHMQPVPVGRKGELYTGGLGVALGYWERPDLTATRFVDDPFSKVPGAKLYRTGDMVCWRPDGTIDFLGRMDGQVKVRGFRIELGEIENAISLLPAVKDRVVIARNDGPAEKQLVAYLVPRQANGNHQEELSASVRDHLRDVLPDYMVPSAFVVLPKLPLTGNGKVDRRALPAPGMQPGMEVKHVGPRNDTEASLLNIWKALLHTSSISVHDNFFDIGGHSLVGLQMLAQVERELQVKLPFKVLFQASTIAKLAAQIKQGQVGRPEWENLSAVQVSGSRPPFFLALGDVVNAYLPRYLGEDQPLYGFFHQGEDGMAITRTKVEDIAAHYIKELKQARPNGPYFLGGYSFGGVIAFEMACQLTAANEDVPLVALFESYTPEEMIRTGKFEERMEKPPVHWKERLWQLFMHGKVANFIRRHVVIKYCLMAGKPIPRRFRKFYIFTTYLMSIAAYTPSKFGGRITMIRTRTSAGAQDMGWSKHAEGGVEVRFMDGDHYTMVQEPFVQQLAHELRQSLDEAMALGQVHAG